MHIRPVLKLTLLGCTVAGLATAAPTPGPCANGYQALDGPFNGATDANITVAPAVLGDHLGRSVTVGDFDGDGQDDLAVAAEGDDTNGRNAGAVYVFFGPFAATASLDPSTADVTLLGEAFEDNSGWVIANAGDVDNDNTDDLLIGSLTFAGSSGGAGLTHLVSGGVIRTTTSVDLATQSTARFFGEFIGDEFGSAVAGGDVNGDGFSDVIIGAPKYSGVGYLRGAAYVFLGPVTGDTLAATADVRIDGALDVSSFGLAVGTLGDLDGDGRDEIGIGAPRDDTSDSRAGAFYVFDGAPTFPATLSAATANLRLYGRRYDRAGASLSPAGDLDGDGTQDFWVGLKQLGGTKVGAVFAFSGGMPDGAYTMDVNALHRVYGSVANTLLGTTVVGGHDFDGDGIPDLLVGGERGPGQVFGTGAVYVEHGPWTVGGARDMSTYDAWFRGALYQDFLGATIAAGDLNGDGYDDAFMGAWRSSDHAYRSGAAMAFYGGDEPVQPADFYADTDSDGFGDPAVVAAAQCAAPPGFVDNDGDCDDSSALYRPSAPEGCADPDYNCDGATGPVDNDLDGVAACEGDCDDFDAAVNPSAEERCGDGMDNDCDGAVDDATAVDAVAWFADGDADGFGNALAPFVTCTAPPFLGITTGGDCDDGNPAINPAALEVCDGTDNDCDGIPDESDSIDATTWYADVDGDGAGDPFDALRSCTQPTGYIGARGDCDDNDGGAGPSVVETCDLVDNDCDGLHYLGGTVAAADRYFLDLVGGVEGARLGATGLAVVPDQDLDGDDELLLLDPGSDLGAIDGGAVFLRLGGPQGGQLTFRAAVGGTGGAWNARIVGSRRDTRLGASVAFGDVNGDAFPDLVIGGPGARLPNVEQGAVFVFYGPIASGELDMTAANVILRGESGSSQAGYAVATGDVNNDGYADMLIGAPRTSEGGVNKRGKAYLVYGGPALAAQINLSAADASVLGIALDDEAANAVALADLDGDSHDDLVIAATKALDLDRGAVYVVWGGATPLSGALTADVTLSGGSLGERFGQSIANAGDMDGDGTDDLIIGTTANAAYIVSGDASRLTSGGIATRSRIKLTGTFGAQAGRVVKGAGDVNGDGLGDVLIVANDDDTAGRDAGAVYLVYGRAGWDRAPTGAFPLASLESFGRVPVGTFPTISALNLGVLEGAKLVGTAAFDGFGASVAAGDVDGDGRPDLLVGAPGSDVTGVDNGRVAVVLGGPFGIDLDVTDGSESTWYADADLDGYTDAAGTPFDSCPMHVPTNLANNRLKALPAPTTALDCNDANGTVHPCAVEANGDGVDSNCDGSDNIVADFDGDGLTYAQEINTYGTCPELADTDGDGVTDPDEIYRGSDPTDPSSVILGIDDLAAGDLRITEFMANPDLCTDAVGEYVEILNTRNVRIDLGGLELADNTNSTFLSGLLVINPHQRVVLGITFAGFSTCYGQAPFSSFTFGLGNSGDSFHVLANSVVIDEVDFNSGSGFAVAAGQAWELDDFDLTTWCVADSSAPNGDTGSPGAPNGSCGGGTGYPGIATLNPGDLVITEVMADAAACVDEGGEYVEVLFLGSQTTDLSGLEIKDSSNTVALGAVVVNPGDRIVLARISAQFLACYGFAPDAAYGFGLDNSGDSVTIADGLTTFDSFDFSAITITPGTSFEVDDANLTTFCLANTLASSGDYGTPGTANGTCIPNDFDRDGLADADEPCQGTDPFDADSDDDGANDGVEITNGTNPHGDPSGLDARSWRFTSDTSLQYTVNVPATDPSVGGAWGGTLTFDPTTVDSNASATAGSYALVANDWTLDMSVGTVQVSSSLATSATVTVTDGATDDTLALNVDTAVAVPASPVGSYTLLWSTTGGSFLPAGDELPFPVGMGTSSTTEIFMSYAGGGSVRLRGALLSLYQDDDLDGVSNAAEVVNGTDPWSADSDGDGLTDADELALSTLACAADSDGDGASDGVEDTLGTDPLNPADRPLTPADLVPSDLTITEFLADPVGCSAAAGEYIEILYTGATVVALDGLVIADAGNSHVVSSGLVAYPGDRILFARDAGFSACYGFAPGDVTGLGLGGTGDTITVSYGGTTLDNVNYTLGFVLTAGVANELDDVDGTTWCQADAASPGGDLGSPGTANGVCPPPSSNLSIDDMVVGDLLITEIMSNPNACGDADGEYVEVLYTGTLDMDLNGAKLCDSTNCATFTGTYVLSQDERVIFARNATTFSSCYAGASLTGILGFNFGLSSSDVVEIRNTTDVALDSVSITGDTPGETAGISVRLSDADQSTWCNSSTVIGTSGDFGTPGTANGACAVAPASPKVFISEVVDWGPNASGRYVELYNAGDAAADLSLYQIQRYANGASTSPATVTMTGTLAPGATYAVGATGTFNFTSTFGAPVQQQSGSISGNGDDVYALALSGTIVDVFGVVGVDGTGENWEYSDGIATRNCFVTEPTATFDIDQWSITAANNTTDHSLGTHNAACVEGSYTGAINLTFTSFGIPYACPGTLNLTFDVTASPSLTGVGTCVIATFGIPVTFGVEGDFDPFTGELTGDILDGGVPITPWTGSFDDSSGTPHVTSDPWSYSYAGLGTLSGSFDIPLP